MTCNYRGYDLKAPHQTGQPWFKSQIYLTSSDVTYLHDLIAFDFSAAYIAERMKDRWEWAKSIPGWMVYLQAVIIVAEIKWAKNEDQGCGVIVESYLLPPPLNAIPNVFIRPQ